MNIFITGASGFIGSNLAKRILTTEPDTKVIGLDNMNDYMMFVSRKHALRNSRSSRAIPLSRTTLRTRR